jgi:hypothetical protein
MLPGPDLPDFRQPVQWFQGDFMRKVMAMAVLAAGVGIPMLAWGDAREDVVRGMTRCAAYTEDRQWLECYYGAAQPMRAWLGLPPAPQSQLRLLEGQPQGPASAALPPPLPATVTRAVTRSGPPPAPKRSGLFDVFGGSEVVKNAPVQSYEVTRDGFTVTLPDGQVWRQTDADAARNPVHWREPASSMRVTISQGAVHTFNLVVNDENTHYKVLRVR